MYLIKAWPGGLCNFKGEVLIDEAEDILILIKLGYWTTTISA